MVLNQTKQCIRRINVGCGNQYCRCYVVCAARVLYDAKHKNKRISLRISKQNQGGLLSSEI